MFVCKCNDKTNTQRVFNVIASGRVLDHLAHLPSTWSEWLRNIVVVVVRAVYAERLAEWPDCWNWPTTCWRASRVAAAARTAAPSTTTNKRTSCASSKTARLSDSMADRSATRRLPVATRRCRSLREQHRCLQPLCQRSSDGDEQ